MQNPICIFDPNRTGRIPSARVVHPFAFVKQISKQNRVVFPRQFTLISPFRKNPGAVQRIRRFAKAIALKTFRSKVRFFSAHFSRFCFNPRHNRATLYQSAPRHVGHVYGVSRTPLRNRFFAQSNYAHFPLAEFTNIKIELKMCADLKSARSPVCNVICTWCFCELNC